MTLTGGGIVVDEKKRLSWQCRRGMRELDVLLLRWLDARHARASDAEKAAFRTLLELPDPELAGYLVRGEPVPDDAAAAVVSQIRRYVAG